MHMYIHIPNKGNALSPDTIRFGIFSAEMAFGSLG